MKAKNIQYKVNCWINNNVNIVTYQNEALIKHPVFILCDGDEPIDLSDSTNIFYKATDSKGNACCLTVNTLSAIEGKVELPVSGALTANRGTSAGEIVVQSDEGTLSFGGINIVTYSSVANQEIEKSNFFTALVEALAKVAVLTPDGTVAMDTELNQTSVNPLTNKAVTEAITTLKNTKIDTVTATREIANAKSEAITKADLMIDDYDKTQAQPALEKKADKQDTENSLNQKIDTVTATQEMINLLPQHLNLNIRVTARAICVDGENLYHTGTVSYTTGGVKHMYATSKINTSVESNPTFVNKIGGHDKVYPRGAAVGNGYLYVPYRDSKSGETTSFVGEDIGGYLDIIKLSDFTLANTIVYSREPYVTTMVVNGVEQEVTKFFGKSHFAATYNDKYLCVTQQMGGWKLYDISTTPENPVLLYAYDNRADIYKENANKKGYADFQQPVFFADSNNNIYLAISGYDRDLLMIYDLSNPASPSEVFGYHSGNNQLNIRTIVESGSLTGHYIHTLGVAVAYPYLYCTIAPHPDYLKDTEKAFAGIVVVNVSDINNVKTSVFKLPNNERATIDTGEPSPCTIAVNSKHLVFDNAEKGIAVWSLINKEKPEFLANLNTGTVVCSVVTTEDGRTFVGAVLNSKYDNAITMYRGI